MKRQNKLTWIMTVSFLLFFMPHQAQHKVSFAYDAAGNRISRTIVLGAQKAAKEMQEEAVTEPEVFNDKIGERTVRIYPNPTKGNLQVELVGGDRDTQTHLMVYNTQGVLLQNKAVTDSKTDINMTDYASGWYILHIKEGDKVIEYKIIKE